MTKVVLILPAFNSAKTLQPFLESLPKNIFDQIIFVDDKSTDETVKIAKQIKQLTVYQNPRNLGYGGNLKMCLGLALDSKADIIVELHPDGEYQSDGIIPALKEVQKGSKLVIGNRFTNGRPRGMSIAKYLITRTLTGFDNLVLGTNFGDLHQGFRVYTRDLLESINFQKNHHNYLFSFEIIIQTLASKLKISQVPVTAKYSGKKRGASIKNSILYTLGAFSTLTRYFLQKVGARSQSIFIKPTKQPLCPNCEYNYLVNCQLSIVNCQLFFCSSCQNGFIYPTPKDLSHYYPKSYWEYEGILGKIRKSVFAHFQLRRRKWLNKYLPEGGNVLEVGSGEGEFKKNLNQRYKVTCLEAPFAKLDNKQVITTNFLNWQITQKFDAIVFWESLEHTPKPKDYLQKAAKLLKNQGLVLIEYPRYGCLESKLFNRHWFHLDIPRHLVDLTEKGLVNILKQSGLTTVKVKTVFAPDYAPIGLLFSVMDTFGIKASKFLERPYAIVALFLLAPLTISLLFFQTLLYLFGDAPIGLVVAKKNNL